MGLWHANACKAASPETGDTCRTYTDIARLLFITYKAIDCHLRHVYQKLDFHPPRFSRSAGADR